jgi:hypothetical protein
MPKEKFFLGIMTALYLHNISYIWTVCVKFL